ncbi:replication initiator protein [robinz microvirus RP_39]|nr:replication initiator protein [robinz microvirus RP_39]
MKCHDPYTDIGGAFACGKCPACLSGRRRTWAHRIQLEALQHGTESAFVTLTYSEDRVPLSLRGLPTLEPGQVRRWLHRFRKGGKFRYFVVGEYGDQSGRPHYHAAIYGRGNCAGGPVRAFFDKGKLNRECLCEMCSAVRTTWGFGHIMVGSLTAQSAMYIAGYTTKHMTHSLDPRLDGRYPEFARMSLNPGIGAYALQPVVLAVRRSGQTVPAGLRHSERVYPLGRYLRREIAKKIVGQDKEFIRSALGSSLGQQKVLDGMQIVRRYASENDVSVSQVFTEINGARVATAKKVTL